MQRKSSRSNLGFITDASLRRKIEGAIETISFLYLKRNEKGISAGFSSEIRRMEILYAASIIEAIFIYLFKKRKESIFKTEYKDVRTLPAPYHFVVARQIQTPKTERELMLDNLLDFFSKSGVIKKKLKWKIDTARNVRNTFHLAKSRKGIRCDTKSVNSAYDAVVEVFSVARNLLKNKP